MEIKIIEQAHSLPTVSCDIYSGDEDFDGRNKFRAKMDVPHVRRNLLRGGEIVWDQRRGPWSLRQAEKARKQAGYAAAAE